MQVYYGQASHFQSLMMYLLYVTKHIIIRWHKFARLFWVGIGMFKQEIFRLAKRLLCLLIFALCPLAPHTPMSVLLGLPSPSQKVSLVPLSPVIALLLQWSLN